MPPSTAPTRWSLLLLLGCGALSLACPPLDRYWPDTYADIPYDTESATITMTAVVPQGSWTLRVEGDGELSDEVREPSENVTSSEQTCVEPCLARDYVLRCPRGKCTFQIDFVGARAESSPLTLGAGFILEPVDEDGCGKPDPNAVPHEDIDRLFDLGFEVQDVVRRADGGLAYPDGGYGTPTARGSMVDARDGQRYATVTLGSQTWLAQNLNFGAMRHGGLGTVTPAAPEPETKLCPNDEPESCEVFGGLYSWTEALGLPHECTQKLCAASVAAGRRGICPEGWHIPSRREWNTLLSHVAAADVALGGEHQAWASATPALKSPLLWQAGAEGSNESEFAALPAATWVPGSGFALPGQRANFHSSEEYDSHSAGVAALFSTGGFWAAIPKEQAISVRCVRD